MPARAKPATSRANTISSRRKKLHKEKGREEFREVVRHMQATKSFLPNEVACLASHGAASKFSLSQAWAPPRVAEMQSN